MNFAVEVFSVLAAACNETSMLVDSKRSLSLCGRHHAVLSARQ